MKSIVIVGDCIQKAPTNSQEQPFRRRPSASINTCKQDKWEATYGKWKIRQGFFKNKTNMTTTGMFLALQFVKHAFYKHEKVFFQKKNTFSTFSKNFAKNS